ncbi:MAG: hypothetical protein LBS62_06305 [Clostridiales bacterium]|jgi:predicted HAD superfamily Cof-like phosphohydrolase|nr:hypothetical protein [Clostridiales bacterium]
MNRNYEQVKEFHRKFKVPVKDRPEAMPAERAAKRCNWMREELDEFMEAADICGQADAMIDLIYFALGTLVEIGVEPDALFDIVHAANMSKLWKNGQPCYREDGKIIKPPGWADPSEKIQTEIARQLQS